MMVYGVLKDPILRSKFEADIIQYYPGQDLYDFYRGEMYFRRLWVMFSELPVDSRTSKYIRNDPLNTSEHLLLSVVDGINLVNFHTFYDAAAGVGKDWPKISKKSPKPAERPKFFEEESNKPKKKFTPIREAQAILSSAASLVDHTDACKRLKVRDPESQRRCNCHRKQKQT